MSRKVLWIAVALGLAACGTPNGGPTADSPSTPVASSSTSTTMPPDTTSASTADTTEGVATVPTGEDIVKAAVLDLAGRLDVDQGVIKVISVETVTWRDGSIGCRDGDKAYIQVLIDGTRILLEYDGETYHYHSERDSDPFLCSNPDDRGFVSPLKEQPEISVPPPID